MRLSNDIYKGLEQLSFKAIDIYGQYLNSHFFQRARFDWTIDNEGHFLRARTQAEKQIAQLQEFKDLVKDFADHPDVKPLIKKSIGTKSGMITFVPENFIDSAIRHFYENNLELNPTTFKNHFNQIEAFLFGGRIELSCWTLLLNFDFEDKIIHFSKDLRIRELTEIEMVRGKLRGNDLDSLNYTFAKKNHSRFILEKVIDYDIEVIDEEKNFSGGANPDQQLLKKEFGEVLKSLRILKHSDIHLNNLIHVEFKSFYPSGGKQTMIDVVPKHMTTRFLDLKKDEVDKLLLYHGAIKKQESDFKVPVNRLSFSKDRIELEDRLIDLIIGLESIYRSSGSMHLSLRCGLTISAKDKALAKDIFKFIDLMRELRNKVVHGSSMQKDIGMLTKDNIEKLEEYLRTSIKLKIEQPDLFKKDSAEWNEIYFS